MGNFQLGESCLGKTIVGKSNSQNIFSDLGILSKHLYDGIFQSHHNPFLRVLPVLDLVFVPDGVKYFVHECVPCVREFGIYQNNLSIEMSDSMNGHIPGSSDLVDLRCDDDLSG